MRIAFAGKKGISLHTIQPQLLMGLMVAAAAMGRRGYDCIITSVCEGEHSPKSQHPRGHGVDLRIWHIDQSDREPLRVEIATDLAGAGFDFLLESDHYHLEWDPSGWLEWHPV